MLPGRRAPSEVKRMSLLMRASRNLNNGFARRPLVSELKASACFFARSLPPFFPSFLLPPTPSRLFFSTSRHVASHRAYFFCYKFLLQISVALSRPPAEELWVLLSIRIHWHELPTSISNPICPDKVLIVPFVASPNRRAIVIAAHRTL